VVFRLSSADDAQHALVRATLQCVGGRGVNAHVCVQRTIEKVSASAASAQPVSQLSAPSMPTSSAATTTMDAAQWDAILALGQMRAFKAGMLCVFHPTLTHSHL
jgi:hypothetical protein